MDDKLQIKYPLAFKAFAEQDAFYRAQKKPVPENLTANRARVTELLDKHVPGGVAHKEALMIAAAITLDPQSGMKVYSSGSYGKDFEKVMEDLLAASRNPEAPLPRNVAPLVTSVIIARMEKTMDDIEHGVIKIDDEAVKSGMTRAAMNDGVCLPALDSKSLRDLYETTQFAYFSVLENAARKPKPKPPAPKPPKP